MKRMWGRAALFCTALMMLITIPVHAATDAEIASLMAGAQKYLLDNFVTDSTDPTVGYWTSSGGSASLPDTAGAVAALIETGKYSDPTYAAAVDKAVKYILTYVQADGGIYPPSSYEATYDTGLCLVALGLYGHQTVQDVAFNTAVQNAIDFFVNGQSTDGGWTYVPDASSGYSDMSNTQFAVMGLYYGSTYLNIPINADVAGSWANNLYLAITLDDDTHTPYQYADGHCGYSHSVDSISDYTNQSMTGACLWSLAMIGKGTDPAAQKAIDWFAATGNYKWNLGYRDYYFVYAMAKALAGTAGANNPIGTAPDTHDWLADLKQTLFDEKIADGDVFYWDDESWLSSHPRLTAAFNLMALVFADPNAPGPSKLLPEKPDTDVFVDNQTLIRLDTTGGVTISAAERVNIASGTLEAGVELPVGGFSFILNGLTTDTTVLRITPADPGSLDPSNPAGFLDSDGTIKDGLAWFKLTGGAWKGLAAVPIALGPAGGPFTYLEVTLRDGGPEDQDGTVNGVIVDPGAPGTGYVEPTDTTDGDGGSSNCFIATAAFGSPMADDVMVLRQFRDRHLLTNAVGRALVNVYYTVSPPIAHFIAEHDSLRAATRVALTPIIFSVKYPKDSLGIMVLVVVLTGIYVIRRRRSVQ